MPVASIKAKPNNVVGPSTNIAILNLFSSSGFSNLGPIGGRIECINWERLGVATATGALRGVTSGRRHRYSRRIARSGKLYHKEFVELSKRKIDNRVKIFNYTIGFVEEWEKMVQQNVRAPGWIPGGGAVATDFSSDDCECP